MDICRNYHGGSDTSEAANKSIEGSKGTLRTLVLEYIRGRGRLGATCWEVENGLCLAHQTASARMTELKSEGKIVPTLFRRLTGSGRTAQVYEAVA